MRRMSFFLTQEQILNQTKTVTRRQGWKNLRRFNTLQPIEKGQGLKKGDKQKELGPPICVLSVREERIDAITPEDVAKEGFPGMSPTKFVVMYCMANKCQPSDICRRIEFEYLPF